MNGKTRETNFGTQARYSLEVGIFRARPFVSSAVHACVKVTLVLRYEIPPARLERLIRNIVGK